MKTRCDKQLITATSEGSLDGGGGQGDDDRALGEEALVLVASVKTSLAQ